MAEEIKDKKPGNGDNKDKDKDKKEEKPEKEISGELIVFGVILLMALSVALTKSGGINGATVMQRLSSNIPEGVKEGFRQLTFSYIVLANIASLFFLVGLVYALIKMREAEDKWYKLVYPGPAAAIEDKPKNAKWLRILDHINSPNPSDWRLAILEADILLDDLFDQLGYVGDTIGDKLKKAVRADFETLDKAWEAHKIRNAIAHEGSDFTLTQSEAQRIIGLYQAVFNEFDYI